MLELRLAADRSGDPVGHEWRDAAGRTLAVSDDDAEKVVAAAERAGIDPPIRRVEQWPLSHVELVGDVPDEHGFSDTLVARGLQEGWITFRPEPTLQHTARYERGAVVTGEELVVHAKPKDVRFRVVEAPGRYPDPDEPAGYRVTHEYRLERIGK